MRDTIRMVDVALEWRVIRQPLGVKGRGQSLLLAGTSDQQGRVAELRS